MGTNVIDALMVTLGLDKSGFDKGKAAVGKGLDEVGKQSAKAEKEVDKTSQTLNKLQKQLLAFVGLQQLERFVSKLTEANAEMALFSRNTNVGVTEATAWGNAVEQLGGTAGGAQSTFSMLSRSITEMQVTGQTAILPYLRALGVTLADAQGKARPLDQVLLDLADRFSGMDRPTAFNIGTQMGIDESTLNLLLEGRNSVEQLIRAQKQQSLLTKEQAENSLRLRQVWRSWMQEGIAVAQVILGQVTPVLTNLTKWIKENEWVIWSLVGAMAVWVAVSNPVATAIGVVALAIVGLIDDYQTWKDGGNSLIDWSQWGPGIETAVTWITKLRDIIVDVWNWLGRWGEQNIIGTPFGKWLDENVWPLVARMTGGESGGPTQSSGGGNGASTPTGGADAGYVRRTLQGMGWSEAQAAGIAANLQHESNFNPTAVGDGGRAYGVAQWHPDRQAAYKRWSGKDIRQSSLGEQLAFVNYELTEGRERAAGGQLRRTTTADEAAQVVSRYYERPADTEGEARKRAMTARAMMSGAGVRNAGGGRGFTQSDIRIGQITVVTQATDARGIARDIGTELRSQGVISQADSGVN